jgi:hypothetical protein
MNLLTKILLGWAIVATGMLFVAGGKIESLFIEVGGLKLEVKAKTEQVEDARVQLEKERKAKAAVEALNITLNKELIHASKTISNSYRGTTTLGID